MPAVQPRPRIDWERVALVPICTVLLLVSLGSLVVTTTTRLTDELAGWLSAFDSLLIAVFYILLVWLLLTRPPHVASSATVLPRLLAYVATFLPLTMAFLPRTIPSPAQSLLASILIVGGSAFSVYAVAHLGRSFSVMPQARRLVQTGPYAAVRHPLYVGECVGIIGIVVASPTVPQLAVGTAIIALQIYRALEEEKVLTSAFPDEYAIYRVRVKRFIPGVV